jgi:hypothetical protein
MKKTLLLSLFGMSIIGTNAQIILTSADIATPTKVILQANDTMPTVSIGSAGPGQTWNMAALNTHTIDTLTFRPYSAAPNPKFSSANIAVQFGTGPTYAYLNNNATNAMILGSSTIMDFGAGPSQIDQIQTPGELLANWPSTYLSSFTNNYRINSTYYFGVDVGLGVPFDSIRTHSSVKKTQVFDAWGTITTPLGSYSALRAMSTEVRYDTTDVFVAMLGGWQNNIQTTSDSSASYAWWANGIGFPLVEISKDSTSVTGATWLMSLPITIGVNEYTSTTEVNVYPNPAQDAVNFAVDSKIAKAVQIYDIAGKMIGSFGISTDVATISTAQFANGSYTYSIIGNDNAVLKRGKFSVAK